MRNIIVILLLLIAGIVGKRYFLLSPIYEDKNLSESIYIVKPKQHRYLVRDMRYRFTINSITAQIPYASNMMLHEKHTDVTRLILAIHSTSYNPDTYLNNSLSLLGNDTVLNRETLIIAPAFYRKDKSNLSDIVTWRVSPFWGSSQALYKGKKITLSAYEILDDILTYIITSKRFPNLSDIVILGHSAGGQLVNRYAASNFIEETIALKHGISMRYLVMAPSSYIYFNGERVRRGTYDEFIFPFGANKKYND